jgi:hypothetical protein
MDDGAGLGKEAVRQFFEPRKHIHAMPMAMRAPFEVWAQCPKTEILYGLFHVVMK